MKNSEAILNELKAMSPLLAGIEKINVFSVPDGYFNELHSRIVNFVLLNKTSAVGNITSRNMQNVPQNYFEALSDSILAKVKAAYPETKEEQFEDLSPQLQSLKGKNVLTVPQGYFEGLANIVMVEVNDIYNKSAIEELQTLSPRLAALKDKNVFTIPQGYFNNLDTAVLSMLNNAEADNFIEELESLSPELMELKNKNVFTVSESYFESFANSVLEKIEQPKLAKVITMKKQTSWWRYAAAAVITGIIAFSSLQIFKNKGENSIAGNTALPAYIQESFQYKTLADLNAGIAKLSDADIVKYLEKNGNAMDNELLTKNTDVSGMPSQTDYLSDENTLNSYLDKIDAKTVDKSKN